MLELLDSIRSKYQKHPITMDNMGSGCLEKALELRDKYKGGQMVWVGNIEGESTGIQHAYFIPPNASDSDLALNQADNGYSQYPPLTVGEVRAIGQQLSESIVRDTVRAAKRR